MRRWPLVVADLMETYGVRDDQAHEYSWPFFHTLVWQLLTTPQSRIYREAQQLIEG